MRSQKHRSIERRDLSEKLRNAKEAAARDDAGEREKADLKLLEQEAKAERLRAQRPSTPSSSVAPDDTEAKLDKALKDSFPGSDPVAFVEPAPLKEGDATLGTVQEEKSRKR